MGWYKQESQTEEKEYWLPDELPEPTVEWNEQQRKKRYLLPDWTTRSHPNWYFANTALVSDEYLLMNDGWKLVKEEYPEVIPPDHVLETDPPEKWIDEGDHVVVTYKLYHYIYNPPTVTYFQAIETLPSHLWERDEENEKIYAKYKVRDLTQDELKEKDIRTWEFLRYERDLLIQKTDFIIIKALENGLQVSQEVKDYRQKLRDLPSKIKDIRKFDFDDPNSWPTAPEKSNYYV